MTEAQALIYIRHDPFMGTDRDCDVRMQTVKLVKTRKPHQCMGHMDGAPHEMPAGTSARFEKALIDGDYWGRYYMCLSCMDAEIALANDE